MDGTSYTREQFDVWNEVPLVPQTTGMSCWAAAAAMLVGWREREVVDPAAVASGAGKWSAYREGLEPDDVTELAKAWGLVVTPTPAFGQLDVAGLRDALTRHGPLWLGEASPGLHSIVVTGIYGDGSEDGTFVRINDPWPIDEGERYVLSFAELQRNFRAATEAVGDHAQVLHSGGRGTSSSSYSYEHGEFRRLRLRRRDHHRDDHDHDDHDHDHDEEQTMESYDHFVPRRASVGHVSSYGQASYGQTGQAAGEAYVQTSRELSHDPLRSHGGSGENLCLRWTALPAGLERIDVVVHLHGYSDAAADRAMLEAKVRRSGVVLDRRTRPTLALIPRGRKVTADEVERGANPRRYTFPGLTSSGAAGLEVLVDEALTWLRTRTSLNLSLDRLILTGHSGAGSHLNALLRNHARRRVCNPDELHLFDAIYTTPDHLDDRVDGIVAWATQRLLTDRQTAGPRLDNCGALRIVYRGGTEAGSRRAIELLSTPELLGDRARALAPRYRAERTTTAHDDIASQYGETLLAQGGGADLALATTQGYGTPLGLFEHYRRNPPQRFASAEPQWPTEEQIAETVRESPVQAQQLAQSLQARALSPAWATDARSVDYRHLQTEPGVCEAFSLSGAQLALLAAANSFSLPETGKVIFGLRGCEILETNDGQFHTSVTLSEYIPDHTNSYCVLGVWDRSNDQVAVFRGSTVPHHSYMRNQVGDQGRNCNMMLTGLYTYSVGRHRNICGALREQASPDKVVLRSRNDLIYETNDDFDRCLPSDNIHPSFRSRNTEFSSAGCLTVRGNASVCQNGVSVHINPADGTPGWADFRTRAGLDTAEGPFTFMLLTGREARLVARDGVAHGLQRLRYGSAGAAVRSLQTFLNGNGYGLTVNGNMDPSTVVAWVQYQQARDAGHADGIVTPADATAMGFRL